jgi:hypothetical protein
MIVLVLAAAFVILILYMLVAGLCKAAAKPVPFAPNPRYYFSWKRLERYRAKRGTYAEGRPTMPSEVEDSVEYERRTR